MKSNPELTNYLVDTGVLNTPAIIEAFRKIDRADFVHEDFRSEAYGDYPLPIGSDQTISQPTTVAFMIEKLEPKFGDKILDIGSGSGWTTALLAYIAENKKGSKKDGKVIGVERISELAKFGQENLAKYNFNNARIIKPDRRLGLPQFAPFDKILVSAASESFPEELIDQLKVGGKLVIPVENSIFEIIKGKDGRIVKNEYLGFVFVPLIIDGY